MRNESPWRQATIAHPGLGEVVSASCICGMNAPTTETTTGLQNRLIAPSRFELTVLYFLLGAHTILATDAAIPSGWLMFSFGSFIAVSLWLAIRVSLAAWNFRAIRLGASRWIEGTLVLAVLVTIHTTPIGVAARVYLSEQRLLEQVRLAQGLQREWRGGSVIPCGLLTVQAMIPGERGTVWLETVSGSRLFGRSTMWGGLVYCERGRPPYFSESYYQHLYGPWWVWLQDV